jgi:hypothetical protein
MMPIALLVLVVAMNHFRMQYQSRIALAYQYKFEALRARLHWEAIEGGIDEASEAYQFLDYMLASVAERLPTMSLWSLFGEILITRRHPEEEDYRSAIEATVYQDEGCRDIYQAANKLWIESVQARHKYSIFVAAASLLPIIGLAQLYHQYCRRFRTESSNPMMRTMITG